MMKSTAAVLALFLAGSSHAFAPVSNVQQTSTALNVLGGDIEKEVGRQVCIKILSL